MTNHADSVVLFEYDVAKNRMRLCGFVPELTNLREYQRQGKVHSQIVGGPSGHLYFTTDGGESREEYLMEHPHGYSGGFVDLGNPRFTMVGPGIAQGIWWRGFQIGTLAASEDGRFIVLDEEEALSQLMVFPIDTQ